MDKSDTYKGHSRNISFFIQDFFLCVYIYIYIYVCISQPHFFLLHMFVYIYIYICVCSCVYTHGWLKSSYDGVISAVHDIFFYQWG